jgi:hypothetical protein
MYYLFLFIFGGVRVVVFYKFWRKNSISAKHHKLVYTFRFVLYKVNIWEHLWSDYVDKKLQGGIILNNIDNG